MRPLFLGALVLVASCEPVAPDAPLPDTGRMHVLMVLDPRGASQYMMVEGTIGTIAFRDSVRAVVRRDMPDGPDSIVSVGRVRDQDECYFQMVVDPSHSGAAARCLVHDFFPVPGARYVIEVSAVGRPTATASSRFPGPFEIIELTTTGEPAGSGALEIRWTPSVGSYGYLVAVRSEDPPPCPDVSGCEDGWLAVTHETQISTAVPGWVFEEGPGPWWVDVLALDRGLFEYLTTGSGGAFFSVPPVQNILNGYGVFGAFQFDSHPLTGLESGSR